MEGEEIMIHSEIQSMLDSYTLNSTADSRNAIKEIVQEIALQSLAQTDFFSKAAFYGGTSLRVFHGLDRFSEDMDFSLMEKDPKFDFDTYLPVLEENLASYGFQMSAEMKRKKNLSTVRSAFLKGNTLVHVVKFTQWDPPVSGIPSNELLKIKLEIDTNPPSGAGFENKFKLLPKPYAVNLYNLPSLFAGKIHALVCRNWKNRIKGRDFYDFIWFLSKGIPVNLFHLEQRMKQTGHLPELDELTLLKVKTMLKQHFESLDFEKAKEDVLPFIKNPNVLNMWSRDFFISITEDNLRQD